MSIEFSAVKEQERHINALLSEVYRHRTRTPLRGGGERCACSR